MNYFTLDGDDDMSLADMMSMKINVSSPNANDKKMDTNTMWNDWSYQNELYHQQMQSSYYQLQYLQQQQMMMMMRNSTSSRRSSTVSSASSNASRYRPSLSYQLSPSTSNSSVKHRSEPTKRTAVTPINTSSRSNRMSPSSTSTTPTTPNSIELPKRRQSLGKRIKKVFGMTEHGAAAVADKRQAAGELPKLIPVDTSFSASPSSSTKSKGRSSPSPSSLPSPSFMAHNTSLPASPNSSISSRHNHHHHRRSRPPPFAAVEQLPSPAASTVSTTTCSSNTDSSITTNSSKKSLSFNPVIKLHETFSAQEYDRRCDTGATCQKLTPVLALKIKEELNNFKLNDMFVHMDSRQNTHFFL